MILKDSLMILKKGHKIIKDSKRILFINPFGIGDCLFTTPLISALKKELPSVFLGFWCNERVSEILKTNPKIDIVFPLSRGDIKRIYARSPLAQLRAIFGLYSSIKKEKFDLALDFSLDYRYSLFSKLCFIKRRLGIDFRKRGKFLTQKLEISGYIDKHIVEYYLELLNFLSVKAYNPRLEAFIDEARKTWAKDFLAKNNLSLGANLIAVCPGGGESWGKDAFYKRWAPEKFSRVCDRIIRELGARILLFGNEQEEETCNKVYNFINEKEAVVKAYPEFSLSEFAALLARCKILLTNDGGPLHMAVALGVKTVSIFGPVSEIVYGPYPISENHIVIKADVECRPCYENFKMPGCCKERECLRSITSEEVFEAVRRLL